MIQEDLTQLTEQQLVELITYHNQKYWAEGEPEISDDDYDRLVRALTAINPVHPLLSRIEAPIVAGSGKIVHQTPMLSLDKAYSLEEVIAWAKKFARSPQEALIVQPKYDGISALWSDGILATRGDGETGENITDKTPLIELEAPGVVAPLDGWTGTARGEIVIRDDDFRTLYSTIRNRNGKIYKNSRNAVAGIMGLKDIREMQQQHAKLTLVDYRLFSWNTRLDRITDDWQFILEKAEALPYPMDGLVIKIADDAYSASLGNTAHHPRGQIAFKFSGVRRDSKLLAVEWSFGKNCLTPVAEIEPVDIGGITIRHASLHNLQNVLEKDLQIGDTVTVERAGDVIPYIVSAQPGSQRTPCLIENCPCCGTKLVRDLPELRCPNPDCPETRLKNLAAAVKNIGIERLGEPNIRKMMNTLGVRHLSDIFRLTKADILRLEGFQTLSADNLLKEIAGARTVPDWQVLAALNIRGIGPNMAKTIMREHTLEELRTRTVDELSRIDGIGPERADALCREMREQSTVLDELLACVTVTATKNSGSGTLPTICFTGKMPEKRSCYEDLARNAGYEPVDSVNSDLTLLVCMDPNDGSSKLKKAQKNGIRILQLNDWLAEIAKPPASKTDVPQEPDPGETETTAGARQPDLFDPQPDDGKEPVQLELDL